AVDRGEAKGKEVVFEALPLLRRAAHLNFIGNVEGRDVFRGTCDVVVADGFTGNVVLKTAESAAELLFRRIRAEVSGDPLAMLGTLLMRPALRRLMRQLDWEEHAAAPLLGVNGVCFVGQGSSSPKA